MIKILAGDAGVVGRSEMASHILSAGAGRGEAGRGNLDWIAINKSNIIIHSGRLKNEMVVVCCQGFMLSYT